jgi:hypothetical protein
VAIQSGTSSSVATAYLDVDLKLIPVSYLISFKPALRLRSDFGVVASTFGSPPAVAKWFDLSSNGNDVTGNANSAPLLLNRSAGQAVVRFTGASSLTIPTLTQSFVGASIFIVTKPNALTPGARLIDYGTGAIGNNNILMQISNSGDLAQYSVFNGTSGSSVTSSAALTEGFYQLLDATQPQDTSKKGAVSINGVAGADASLNTPPGPPRNANYIGQSSAGTDKYTGDISEVLVFYGYTGSDCGLTATQREAVRAMFMNKYQLFSQVPAAPIISVASGTLLQPSPISVSADPDTVVYITNDGSTPSATSQIFDGQPIFVNYTQTIKAIAVKAGIASSVASASYVLDANQFPAPSPSDTTAPNINLVLPAASQ